jgi:hypothetical protein
LPAEVHLVIEAVSASGEPTHPKVNATKFVNECGVLVRDHIPISTQEWHEPKKRSRELVLSPTKRKMIFGLA